MAASPTFFWGLGAYKTWDFKGSGISFRDEMSPILNCLSWRKRGQVEANTYENNVCINAGHFHNGSMQQQ